MPSEPSKAGIVTGDDGTRHIPESTRADGSTRKAIKIRPGYRPPEDVEIYKNRAAEGFRNRGNGPVPGSEGLKDDSKSAEPLSATAAKNAKRREAARKKKEAAAETAEKEGGKPSAPVAATKAVVDKEEAQVREADPEVEKEKQVRNLKKKLRQAKELQDKKESGGTLLPEQLTKVIRITELIRELEALGFDSNGEPKGETTKTEPAST